MAKAGRKRVQFTVSEEIYAELLESMRDAGIPIFTLGPILDDAFRGLTVNFKEVAKAKREGRQLSFGQLLGLHIQKVVDEVSEDAFKSKS